MRRYIKTILSYLLTVTLIFSNIPLVTSAEKSTMQESSASSDIESVDDTIDAMATADAVVETQEPEILSELIDKRDETTKYFEMSDGTIKACIYPQNVHYLENGKYEEIDNTLVETVENDKTYYKNKKNGFSVKMPEAFADDYIEFSDENGYVKFKLLGATNKKLEKIEKETKSEKKDPTIAQNVNDRAVFKEIKGDIDIEYDLAGNKLKETIVLHKKTKNAFVFDIQTSADKASLNSDNSISFYDLDGVEIYTIDAPYMTDADGEYSNHIETELLRCESGFQLTYTPDYEWLSAKERVYPVRIDPTLFQAIYKQTVTDTYVSNVQTSSNPDIRGYWDVLNIGRRTTSVGNGNQLTKRGFIRFEIPSEIGKNDCIVEAKLDLIHYTVSAAVSVNGIQIDVHELTSGFTEGGTYWGNQPNYDPIITDYVLVNTGNYFSGTSLSYDSYNLTRLVNKWHNGAANYGIMLKLHDESTSVTSSKQVYYFAKQSTYYGSVSKFVEITYRNATGLEDYWSYTTQDFGQYGVGYVNNYNGNLVYVHDDISFDSLVNDFTLSHVYNANLTNHQYLVNNTSGYFGTGWRLNLVQKLEPATVTGNSSVKYVYTDGDGTRHYLVQLSDGSIVDEDGLGYTYANISDGEFARQLTDKNGTILKFDIWGYLRRIIDSNGNTIFIGYAPVPNVDNYISAIATSSGASYSLSYDSNYKLTTITEDNTGRSITYSYTGDNLTKITYPDGTSLNFEYTSGSKWLNKITAPDGMKLQYEHMSSTGKISRAKSYGTNGSESATTDFTYLQNQTRIVDSNNNGLTYQFDTWGRVTGIYDDNQNIHSQTYTSSISNGSGIFKNNKLATSSNGVVYVNNLLANPVFINGLTSWTSYKENSNAVISAISDVGLITPKSIKITSSGNSDELITQSPTLITEPTYTFSGYIKTENVVSAEQGAALAVVVTGENGVKEYYSDFVTGTTNSDIDNGFMHVSVTFTLEDGETLTKVTAGLHNASGTVYVDSLQLEEGDTANQINMIDNSSFERTSGLNTTPTAFANSYNDALSGSSTTEKVTGTYSHTICGNVNQDRFLYQKLIFNGKAGDVYSFGGWGKGNAVPRKSNTKFNMLLYIEYNDGTVDWVVKWFNHYVDDWQFVKETVVTKKDYKRIDLYCLYKNFNTAYFDNVFLYRDTMESYTYDENGNVISTSDYAKQNTTFEYSNNNLSKLIQPTGSYYDYTYDNKHNLTSAQSSEGLVYNITYDVQGNVIATETKSAEDSEKITSTATYQYYGNYPRTITDARGNTTTYTYDTSRGLQTGVTDAKGNTTSYTYNALNDRLESVNSGTSTVSYQYETNGSLKKITTANGTVYNFVYDAYGRTSQILVGNSVLSQTTYRDNSSSQVARFDYGNGTYRTYSYDEQDRLISESINGTIIRSYVYDKSGNVAKIVDHTTNVTTTFRHDLIGRTIEIKSTDGQRLQFNYDMYNRLSMSKWILNSYSCNMGYIYGDSSVDGQKTGLIYGVTLNGTQQLSYQYDELTRLSVKTLNTTTPFVTEYGYLEGASTNTTTTLIKTVKNGNDTLEYTYDELGNITSVSKNGTVVEQYSYDALSQLVSATYGGNTYTYSYDNGGNITEIKKNDSVIKSYTYGNSEWKDLLTAFNGETITYDDIGNPLTYRNGMAFTWQNGRQLASVSQNGTTVATYTYDADGLRTSKIVGETVTEYYWMNGRLYGQKTGSEYIFFLYDENGSVYGFVVKNSSSQSHYYYEFNLQGDIIGIIDSSGTRVVEYTYGAWGDILSITGTMADTIGQKNPLRYRGYYYDAETGFYYLQSRYYDAEICRFLNADGYVSTGQGIVGNNMFVYCGNNPVNRADTTGMFFKELFLNVYEIALSIIAKIKGSSESVGAALPYVDMAGSDNPNSPNCYAYAIGSSVNEQPGATSGRAVSNWADVNDVGASVEADLHAKGYTIRKISGPNGKILEHEYRIALRVGTQPYARDAYGNLYYDYHFMRQTDTGCWAEKHGIGGPSILWDDASMTPDNISWTLGNYPYYDSPIIYYAIGL